MNDTSEGASTELRETGSSVGMNSLERKRPFVTATFLRASKMDAEFDWNPAAECVSALSYSGKGRNREM